MAKATIKKIDSQGRVSLPIKWRKEAMKDTEELLLIEHPDRLELIPKRDVDLTEFFDSVEVDFEICFDYHELKKRLMEERI